jgi:hypothetical protein
MSQTKSPLLAEKNALKYKSRIFRRNIVLSNLFFREDNMKKMSVAVIGFAVLFAFCSGFAWAGSENSANTWYGYAAGSGLTSGTANSFFGYHSGMQTKTGEGNSFFGYKAGSLNEAGDNNTYVGNLAGLNSLASDNTFIGYAAGWSNNTGSANIFAGSGAGYYNTTGTSNTFIGYYSGFHNDTGGRNTYLGYNSGVSNVSGQYNVFLGYGAGANETGSNKLYIDNCYTVAGCTDPLIYGEFDNRLVRIDGTIETTAGVKYPDGTIQTSAPAGVHSGSITSFGNSAGSAGSGNTFLGNMAGMSNTGSGNGNSFIGDQTGTSNTTGSLNTFVGQYSGYSNTTGGRNTFIGHNAGYANNGGQYNVFLGYKAGSAETGSHKLYIDNCYTGGSCDDPLIYGEFNNRLIKISGRLVFSSDERLKKNIEPLNSSLDKVMKIRGVSYEWKSAERRGKGRDIGLIAQDVETVIPELVVTDDKGYKALSYDRMVPVLVEAIKEQQKTISEKSRVIDEQRKDISDLKKAMAGLSDLVDKLRSGDMTAQR